MTVTTDDANRRETAPLLGLMQDGPLLVRAIAERAEHLFGSREVVSRTQDGVERSTYGEVVGRARRLASALAGLGVRPGDRVATFGWNSRRHLELYLAVPAMGAVLHTLNIRLFEDDLRYIVGHAEDRVVFLDACLASVMPRFDGVEHEVLMRDGPGERDGALGDGAHQQRSVLHQPEERSGLPAVRVVGGERHPVRLLVRDGRADDPSPADGVSNRDRWVAALTGPRGRSLYTAPFTPGEVAEWLKALAC